MASEFNKYRHQTSTEIHALKVFSYFRSRPILLFCVKCTLTSEMKHKYPSISRKLWCKMGYILLHRWLIYQVPPSRSLARPRHQLYTTVNTRVQDHQCHTTLISRMFQEFPKCNITRQPDSCPILCYLRGQRDNLHLAWHQYHHR